MASCRLPFVPPDRGVGHARRVRMLQAHPSSEPSPAAHPRLPPLAIPRSHRSPHCTARASHHTTQICHRFSSHASVAPHSAASTASAAGCGFSASARPYPMTARENLPILVRLADERCHQIRTVTLFPECCLRGEQGVSDSECAILGACSLTIPHNRAARCLSASTVAAGIWDGTTPLRRQPVPSLH